MTDSKSHQDGTNWEENSSSGNPSFDESDLYSKIIEESQRSIPIESRPSEFQNQKETILTDDQKVNQAQETLYSANAKRIPAPQEPVTLQDTGLSIMDVGDLILKLIYLRGNLKGQVIARELRLPFTLIRETLIFLRDEKCLQVPKGDTIGPASYQFTMTDYGRNRAHEAFERNRYVGPAPVSLPDYVKQCNLQKVSGMDCREVALKQAFADLIISDDLINELGPAVCSGKSIFLYGPPGNGKSRVAKGLGKFLSMHGGDIYIPYALQTEGTIVTLFDPVLHHPTDNQDQISNEAKHPQGISMRSDSHDTRWRRIQRPVVVTGGELTLDMLDLRFNEASKFYTAPLHIKANCGVFLIDDFGRQIVSPKDLLNRWILPLEERIDYLSLISGKKFSVPFEQMTIFSTNLDPKELVDDAFLRRIRHKIEIQAPTREVFTKIFKMNCVEKRVEFNLDCLDYLLDNCYSPQTLPKSSDPRDLLEIAESICRFKNEPFVLTEELIEESTKRHFCIS